MSVVEGDDASPSPGAAGGAVVVGEVIANSFIPCILSKSNFNSLLHSQVNMVTLRPSASDGESGGGGGGVLHRVGNQQSKWQKTVMEQRRNIYDRRTILN